MLELAERVVRERLIHVEVREEDRVELERGGVVEELAGLPAQRAQGVVVEAEAGRGRLHQRLSSRNKNRRRALPKRCCSSSRAFCSAACLLNCCSRQVGPPFPSWSNGATGIGFKSVLVPSGGELVVPRGISTG